MYANEKTGRQCHVLSTLQQIATAVLSYEKVEVIAPSYMLRAVA